MRSSSPPSSYETINQYRVQYEAALAAGTVSPFVFPQQLIPALVLMAYLMIPRRADYLARYLKYPVFAFITYFSVSTILFGRSPGPAADFGIGLVASWSILWSGTLMIFNDARRDFKRIERSEKAQGEDGSKGATNGIVGGPELAATQDQPGLRARGTPSTKQTPSARGSTPNGDSHLVFAHKSGTFTWQVLPSTFTERLDWVADLVCNFRGLGWNFRIPGIPPPPEWVQSQLHDNDGTEPEKGRSTHISPSTGTVRYHTRRALLTHTLLAFITTQLILDLAKTLLMRDAYFWTGLHSIPPPSYLPQIITTSPILTRTYRLLLSLLAITASLQAIFYTPALVIAGLFGPRVFGARAEPWMYPDTYGSFQTNVLDKGLAGWWGGWWHQTFRFAFDSAARWLVRDVFGWEDARSARAKAVRLAVSFVVSGALHAAGSVTMWPSDTRPVRGAWAFFALQGVGMGLQMLLVQGLKTAGVCRRGTPVWLKRTANAAFVFLWLYFTAPLLCDDFARGGIWLYEPVPVSLCAALGWRGKGEGWWRWGRIYTRLYRGRTWWESGLAV